MESGVAETAVLVRRHAADAATQRVVLSHATKDFIAGALSGMVGIIAGQPLDTLRVRLQQQGCQQSSAAALWKAMGATEGSRGLVRGLTYPLSTIALQNAVCFQAQGAAARLLSGDSSSRTPSCWQHTCLSGLFAGAVTSFITAPTELLKIRMQLQTSLPGAPGYLGPLAMLRRVVLQEGYRCGLARGLGITLLRDTPSYGVYFLMYHGVIQGCLQLQGHHPAPASSSGGQAAAAAVGQDAGQEQRFFAAAHAGAASLQQPGQQLHHPQDAHLQAQQQWDPSSSSAAAAAQEAAAAAVADPPALPLGAAADAGLLVQFFAGGCAGALAWMSIYPIDVVKSRMQASPRSLSPYRSAWHCFRASWAAEGPAVFVKGLGPTMGRGFVVNAAIFASFEGVMKAMD